MGSFGSGNGKVAVFCEHDNENSGFTKSGKFLS
jgi:hypothetical protein